jgi:hypothetical protein
MKKPAKFTVRFPLMLSPKQKERADALATQRGMSVGELFRALLDTEYDVPVKLAPPQDAATELRDLRERLERLLRVVDARPKAKRGRAVKEA